MSVMGVGMDLLPRGQLSPEALASEDAFARAAFAPLEHQAASQSTNPVQHYEALFCAKEAIFKSLGLDGNHVAFREIAVLQDAQGAWSVAFTGELAHRVQEKGIGRVQVAISADEKQVMAFAVAITIATERTNENGK